MTTDELVIYINANPTSDLARAYQMGVQDTANVVKELLRERK